MGSAWFDPVADSRKCPDLPLFEGVVFGRLLGLAVGRVSMFEGFFLGDILTLRGEMVIFFVFFGFAVLFPELDFEDLEEVMDQVDLAGEGGTNCDDFPVGKQSKDNDKRRSKVRSAYCSRNEFSTDRPNLQKPVDGTQDKTLSLIQIYT